ANSRQLSGKYLPDNLLDGHFLDVDIADGQFVEQRFTDWNDTVALDFERGAGRGPFHNVAIFAEHLDFARDPAGALDRDQFKIRKAIDDLGELAIKEDSPVIDDDDPLAKLLNIQHVMAGQQHRSFARGVVVPQEFANFLL